MASTRALTEPFVATQEIPAAPPPGSTTGPIAWLRQNLFNSWFNAILTLLIAYLAFRLIPPFIQWALIDPVWGPSTPDEASLAETFPGFAPSRSAAP